MKDIYISEKINEIIIANVYYGEIFKFLEIKEKVIYVNTCEYSRSMIDNPHVLIKFGKCEQINIITRGCVKIEDIPYTIKNINIFDIYKCCSEKLDTSKIKLPFSIKINEYVANILNVHVWYSYGVINKLIEEIIESDREEYTNFIKML